MPGTEFEQAPVPSEQEVEGRLLTEAEIASIRETIIDKATLTEHDVDNILRKAPPQVRSTGMGAVGGSAKSLINSYVFVTKDGREFEESPDKLGWTRDFDDECPDVSIITEVVNEDAGFYGVRYDDSEVIDHSKRGEGIIEEYKDAIHEIDKAREILNEAKETFDEATLYAQERAQELRELLSE